MSYSARVFDLSVQTNDFLFVRIKSCLFFFFESVEIWRPEAAAVDCHGGGLLFQGGREGGGRVRKLCVSAVCLRLSAQMCACMRESAAAASSYEPVEGFFSSSRVPACGDVSGCICHCSSE